MLEELKTKNKNILLEMFLINHENWNELVADEFAKNAFDKIMSESTDNLKERCGIKRMVFKFIHHVVIQPIWGLYNECRSKCSTTTHIHSIYLSICVCLCVYIGSIMVDHEISNLINKRKINKGSIKPIMEYQI